MTEQDTDFRGWYPGSRIPLPAIDQDEPEETEVFWDARPTTKIVNGSPVEFFTIGAIASALGRSAVTIRLWIRNKRIPAATYRLPDRNNIKGRRLYTREQVTAIIEVAEKHGIIGSERVIWEQHDSVYGEILDRWKSAN